MASLIFRVSKFYLHQLKLRYSDGVTEDITKLYNGGGDEEARQIPPKHVIVGLYGTVRKDKHITSLGFVLMDTSPLNLWSFNESFDTYLLKFLLVLYLILYALIVGKSTHYKLIQFDF